MAAVYILLIEAAEAAEAASPAGQQSDATQANDQQRKPPVEEIVS